MKTIILLSIEHDKPIVDLVDKVAQRAWTIDGVRAEGYKVPGEPGAVEARHLSASEAGAVAQVLVGSMPGTQ